MTFQVEVEVDNPAAFDTLVSLIDQHIDELGSPARTDDGFHDVEVTLSGGDYPMRWMRSAEIIELRVTDTVDLRERLAAYTN